MAIRHIDNGNKAFGLHNDIKLGTWGAASINVMLLKGQDSAEIDVRTHGNRARFTKVQLLDLADQLRELAAHMPD